MNKTNKLTLCILAVLYFTTTNLYSQIELKKTIPGTPAVGFFKSTLNLAGDYNNDGIVDASFFQTNADGEIVLAIVNGADYTIWRLIPIPRIGQEVILSFATATVIGYYELDGRNNSKEIVLAEKIGRRYVHPIVIDENGAALWDGSNKILLDIANMDGDVCEEIVVSNPAIPQVEIYGEKK